MCRIDAPFGNHPLNEQEDPVERFIQALDELKIEEGSFRSLLIKHFSEHWKSVFRNISGLEDALSDAKQHNSEADKCIAVLLSNKNDLCLSYDYHQARLTIPKPYLSNFAHDVAQTYFPGSPFSFFNFGMNKVVHDYFLFISWLYGEDFCFTQEFFNDKALSSINEPERTTILWDYFYSIVPQLKSLGYQSDESSFLNELTSIASLNSISGPPTKDSSDILRGFEFIKTWIKFDSQSGRFAYDLIPFLYGPNSPWGKIESLLRSDGTDSVEYSNTKIKWLDDTRLEFNRVLYVNAGLNHASGENIEQWARGLNHHFDCDIKGSIYRDYDFYQSRTDESSVRLSNAFNDLCSQLSSLQINTWVKWSITKDFLNPIDNLPRLSNSEKWGRKEYFDSWKKIFLENLDELELKCRLRILSASVPIDDGQTKEFYSECSIWWNELLRNLIEDDNFPKELTPDWTIVAIGRNELNREVLLPYIDKSIGILRGKIMQSESSEDEMNEYHKQLEKLLSSLDITNPTKAFRHRLFLIRSSKVALSDESVSGFSSLNHDYVCKWYSSLNNLASKQLAYQVNGSRTVTSENYPQVENDFYIAFSHELAEFCLSRLRLRKGEKAKDEKYGSSQVIEQSSIWRQGYLKALTELGFDLNGKVHKTVNFTKKSDPEKDVRDIASECYKAVRRNAKKSPSIQDLKRGIISAEWWLLLCQRKELGLDINYEEALKTRRKLLQNP